MKKLLLLAIMLVSLVNVQAQSYLGINPELVSVPVFLLFIIILIFAMIAVITLIISIVEEGNKREIGWFVPLIVSFFFTPIVGLLLVMSSPLKGQES